MSSQDKTNDSTNITTKNNMITESTTKKSNTVSEYEYAELLQYSAVKTYPLDKFHQLYVKYSTKSFDKKINDEINKSEDSIKDIMNLLKGWDIYKRDNIRTTSNAKSHIDSEFVITYLLRRKRV